MKIFLSYKHTGINKKILKKELEFIKEIIEKTNNEVYIYYFDEIIDETPHKLLETFKNEIKKSDLVIWYINYEQKSEWELIELWIAEWFNKDILLLVNNKISSNFSLIYWLKTDIIYYDNINELEDLLTNYLIWK